MSDEPTNLPALPGGREAASQTNAQLRSLASPLGFFVSARVETMFTDNGVKRVERGYSVTACEPDQEFAGMSRKQRFQKLLEPATDAELLEWLGRLDAITAKRKQSADEVASAAVEYVSRLRHYPGRVVRAALLGETYHWWPTWAELHERIQRLMQPIELLRAELEPRPAVTPALPRFRPKPLPRVDRGGLTHKQWVEKQIEELRRSSRSEKPPQRHTERQPGRLELLRVRVQLRHLSADVRARYEREIEELERPQEERKSA